MTSSQFQHVNGQNAAASAAVAYWSNDSGEEVPPFGVVQVDSYDSAQNLYSIVKPTETGTMWFINGPVAVADGKKGASDWLFTPQMAFVDGPDLDFGKTCGPVGDEWHMGHGSEFMMVSDIENDRAAVVRCMGLRQRRCITKEAISNSADTLGSPSKFTVTLLYTDSAGALVREPSDSGFRELDATQFMENIELEKDTYGRIDWHEGHWEFKAADCEALGSPPA